METTKELKDPPLSSSLLNRKNYEIDWDEKLPNYCNQIVEPKSSENKEESFLTRHQVLQQRLDAYAKLEDLEKYDTEEIKKLIESWRRQHMKLIFKRNELRRNLDDMKSIATQFPTREQLTTLENFKAEKFSFRLNDHSSVDFNKINQEIKDTSFCVCKMFQLERHLRESKKWQEIKKKMETHEIQRVNRAILNVPLQPKKFDTLREAVSKSKDTCNSSLMIL
ncbi:hypothetical protein RFI_06201 [Reticulomyxa filosa]|uniref:Uncharacterized protein n=1 Tax=Reticulomyxa filosa TaxID=46433 RepID=X6NYH2_RETFI|nr:hypothetical protein RFI_06201 [Reticulomyxa filosa]|eukprot:ETO30918.1 hypothetical protein RFI_06201 [Reticulomyxa filosa]